MHTIKSCDNKFIKLCPGLDGTMGNLIIDPGYVAEHEGLPIDMVVTNVANGPVGIHDDEMDDQDENPEVA
jgi:hypothetical protein